MFGWIEHEYAYVPGVLSLNVKFSLVSSTFDLKAWSSLATVWGMSSLFVQVISVPALTVSVVGEKLKLSILTPTLPPAARAFPDMAAGKAIKPITAENAIEIIQQLILLILVISAPLFLIHLGSHSG
jgi:hypothetical protein